MLADTIEKVADLAGLSERKRKTFCHLLNGAVTIAVHVQEAGATVPRQREVVPHLEALKKALADLAVDETRVSPAAALAGSYLRAINPAKTDANCRTSRRLLIVQSC